MSNKKQQKKKEKGNFLVSNFVWVIVSFACIIFLYSLLSGGAGESKEVAISELARDVQSGAIKSITVSGNELEALYTADNSTKRAMKEADASLSETLSNLGVSEDKLSAVTIEIKEETGSH